jgi:hypothetical protein
MLPLPATPYEACEKTTVRVTSLSLVRYRGNDYSVPTEYGHRQVLVKGYVHEVVIACASEVIARHPPQRDVPSRNALPNRSCVLAHAHIEDRPRQGVSVPEHPLHFGPGTSVTNPLRWRWFELRGHEKTHIQSSRPWECGNPEGISKECGKFGKLASWLSWLSILCHFHGLLFARQMLDKPIRRHPVQSSALVIGCSSVCIACH